MHQFINGKLPETCDLFFCQKRQISIMLTLALQVGLLFMFQKLEQTMVHCKFNIRSNGPIHVNNYGMKLMRDLRF